MTCDKCMWMYWWVRVLRQICSYIYFGEFVTCDQNMYVYTLASSCLATNTCIHIHWRVCDLREMYVYTYIIGEFVTRNKYMYWYTLASSCFATNMCIWIYCRVRDLREMYAHISIGKFITCDNSSERPICAYLRLFCEDLGLFRGNLGLFCAHLGLFCGILGFFWKTYMYLHVGEFLTSDSSSEHAMSHIQECTHRSFAGIQGSLPEL